MVSLSTTPVVGLPRFDGWSQVSENSHSSFSRLICAFAVSGDSAGNVGRSVSDRITQQTLASGQEFYKFLNDLDEFVVGQGCRLEIAAALVSKTSSFFAVNGGKILLRRDKKVGKIIESRDQLQILEGKHRRNDIFVLVTNQALSFASEIEQKLIQGYEPDTIVTSVVPGLHGQENSSLSAIAFVSEGQGVSRIKSEPAIEVRVTESSDDDDNESSLEKFVQEENADQFLPKSEVQTAEEKPPSKKVSWLKKYPQLFLTGLWNLLKWITDRIMLSFKALSLRTREFRDSGKLKTVTTFPKKDGAYLENKTDNSLRRRFWLIVISLTIILTIIVVAVITYNNSQKRAQEMIEPYYQRLESARVLLVEDPVEARQQVRDVISELELVVADENSSGILISKADEALTEANTLFEEISGLDELEELNVFYDLRLAKSDFVASKVDAFNPSADEETSSNDVSHAVFIDQQQNEGVVLDLQNKRVGGFSLDNISEVKDLRTSQSEIFLLANGLFTLQVNDVLESEGDTPTPQEIIAEGDSNRGATLLGRFQTFLYVFNPERRNIYRYSQQEEGYSEPIGWLQSTLGVAFEDVSSWAIDGDVWVGTKDGGLRRYLRGVTQDFEILGMAEPFDSPISITTTDESEILYVLEPAKNRVVFINKESGAFIREVTSPSLASATNIFVSQQLQKVFPISGSIVFEIEM